MTKLETYFIVVRSGENSYSVFSWHKILNKMNTAQQLGTAITKGKTPVPVCSPKLSPVGRVDIWMGDHLDKIACAVLLGKSGWRSGH